MYQFKSKITLLLTVIFVLSFSFVVQDSAIAGDKKNKGAYMGIYLEELDEDDREALNYEGKHGILIEGVVDEGPSESAGIEAGDILISIDGEDVKSTKKLRKILSKREPEQKIKVLVFRDGKEKKIKMKLGEPAETSLVSFQKEKSGGFLGVVTIDLGDQLAEFFKVEGGVLIQEVAEDTPAEKCGLKAGDIIKKIDDDLIDDKGTLSTTLMHKKPETEVVVTVIREGKEQIFKATLAENTHNSHFLNAMGKYNLPHLGEAFLKDMEDIDIVIHGDKISEELEKLKEEMEKLKIELQKLAEQQGKE